MFPIPQTLKPFRRSQLNWDEIGQPEHQEMLAWHQRLIQLRRRVFVHGREVRRGTYGAFRSRAMAARTAGKHNNPL